jgi:predicted glycoside hydrolase/deacetylase ChbG (UPF0249 family)
VDTTRYLIVNADDFGASGGINRGIVECHVRGIVTSTSLMVTGRAVHEAVALSREYPRLSIGLHWDVWGEDEREFDMTDAPAVRDEVHRQLDAFNHLMGTMPTHVDSHKHAHRAALPLFREMFAPLGIPVRGDGPVPYVGGFYAQWGWGVTDLAHISVAALSAIFETEIVAPWTEVACHPGYRSGEFQSVYAAEHEEEIRKLTDPICPIDWELAAYGPGIMDLAAIGAGSWSRAERTALARSYYEALPPDARRRPDWQGLLRALDDCRLHLAVQWLGWSDTWTPPSGQQQDWLAVAAEIVAEGSA